jgi:hypothetical protein
MTKAAELAKMGEVLTNSQIGGRRNIAINGAMQVSQRATSATGVGSGFAYPTLDRFKIVPSTSGRATMSQSTDAPDGFANSLKLECTTADTSIASGEYFNIRQSLEGQDVQQLKKGTSSAEKVTVSFYVKGNASATYLLELSDQDNTRYNGQTFAVTTSWNRIVLTYNGDTSGVLDNDNARSLDLNFWLHGGSTYTGGTFTSNTWHGTDNQRLASITSFFDSTDRTFFITGLQMEVGSQATPFEHRSYGEELGLCQRYYSREEAATGAPYKRYATGSWSSTTVLEVLIPLSTPMRSAPTLETTGTASNYAIYSAGAIDACTALTITNDADAGTDNRAVAMYGTTSSGGVAGEGGTLLANSDTDNFLALDAEL